jgi:hypothetical protein
VLQVLKRERLIEGRRNAEDGRSTIYSVPQNKKSVVRGLLNTVTLGQRQPKATRAIPFAMLDLENLVIDALKTTLIGWKITAGHKTGGLDVLLQRTDPPLEIGLELKIGGEHFERHLYQFIGRIVSRTELPKVVVVAVFGKVRAQVKSLTEGKLLTLLKPLGTTVKVLWFDQGPMIVDRTYVFNELVARVRQIASAF